MDIDANNIQKNRGWLLALGILFLILGGLGMGMVVGLTLASMFFFGVLLIVAGISQGMDCFKEKYWQGVLWHAFISAFYIIGGILVIYDPFLASALITALLACVLIVIGFSRFFMALSVRRDKGWGWLLFAGLISILLGAMILMHWPMSGLWIIGLFIAIQLIVDGWAYIFLAVSGWKR